MIPKSAVLRVARPTDRLQAITDMYVAGLGFQLLGSFRDHDGFDGAILGHPEHAYHLEFTHHRGTTVGRAPTRDNLLVFYVPEPSVWESNCQRMLEAGFVSVDAYNPYWDVAGRTFEDIDGYRVVLQNRAWS
ncbi:VOC family protein [Marinobacter sp. R17]|uniref:VOC family protein n=1 Tax=Marinobacter sp. R17 TaxID=2484250 RepID=UPI000F4C5EFC|nr:VOC family protein [Marinobacter sp. R17]ROT93645.1 VOC family protein [Marinobacter sp. R17]